MTRYYTFHDQAAHPDEWFCSTEQKWKPKSEFNLRDEVNGLPQWDCRDCQQKRGRDRYSRTRDRVKNINRVAKLNSREEHRENVYTYLCEHLAKTAERATLVYSPSTMCEAPRRAIFQTW